MAGEHLKSRGNWQGKANKGGSESEISFSGVMRQYFLESIESDFLD